MQRVSELEVSTQNGLEERDLTLAFQAGDISSYNEIYRRFRPMVDRICRRMLGNYHDAEEASQEAFLRVYQGLPQFNGRYHLRSWVVRIATNTCLDLIRRRARRPQEFEAADEMPNGTGNGNGNGHHNDDPLEVIITESESDDVRRVLDLLPPHYRAALILREYEGLSYEEIGQALDLNASQIKFLLHRAKKRFRKTYKGAFGNGFFAHPIWILWWFVFGRRAARQSAIEEHATSLASGPVHAVAPASSAPMAAVAQAAAPVVEAAAPVVQASAPIVQAVAPVVQAVAPVMQAVGPVVQAAAPAMHAAPAVASIGSKAVAAVAALAISGVGAVSTVLPRSSQPATPPSQNAAAVQAAPAPASSEAPPQQQSSTPQGSPAPASSPSASSPVASSSPSSAPSPSASESSAPASSPGPETSASPASTSGSGAAAAEPSDFSMTFSSDKASASPCGCGQQPTVASEKVDADNKGVNSFSQRVENAAATDASGQAAWPMWLEHSSTDGGMHEVSFGLTDDQREYRYAAHGQRISRERLHNGTWRYIFAGTYKREPDQTDGVSSIPTQGTYRAEIVFSWRRDRILNMAFTLQEQS